VIDGIFQEGLEEKFDYFAVEGFLVNLPFYLEFVAVPEALDGEIALAAPISSKALLPRSLPGVFEEDGEVLDHRGGGGGLSLGAEDHPVQGIEGV